MSFKSVKNNKPGFRYTICDGGKDICLGSGIYKDYKVSNVLDSKHGYHYIRWLVNNNIVDDKFVAVLINMSNWDESDVDGPIEFVGDLFRLNDDTKLKED